MLLCLNSTRCFMTPQPPQLAPQLPLVVLHNTARCLETGFLRVPHLQTPPVSQRPLLHLKHLQISQIHFVLQPVVHSPPCLLVIHLTVQPQMTAVHLYHPLPQLAFLTRPPSLLPLHRMLFLMNQQIIQSPMVVHLSRRRSRPPKSSDRCLSTRSLGRFTPPEERH